MIERTNSTRLPSPVRSRSDRGGQTLEQVIYTLRSDLTGPLTLVNVLKTDDLAI